MRASVAHSAGTCELINVKKPFGGFTVTILTSLLGTKVLSLIVFMWQEASPAASPAAVCATRRPGAQKRSH